MTTIVAVKKNGRVAIGSDTLTLFGNRKESCGRDVYDAGKIIQVGKNYIGLSGHSSWDLVIGAHFSKENFVPEWKNTEEIFETFNQMHSHLKSFSYLNSLALDYVPFESSDFGILVINSFGIFEVDYIRTVRHYSCFSAIGTGEEYALGAIKASYEYFENPADIAKLGLEAAAQFDRKQASQ